MIDTAELRRLMAEATPGPYAANVFASGDLVANITDDGFVEVAVFGEREEDAELAAAAVNALPALLDDNARMTAENAALRARAEAAEAKVAEAAALARDLLSDEVPDNASGSEMWLLSRDYDRLRALAGKECE